MAGIKSREESIREEMESPINLDVNVDVRIPKSNQMTEKKYKCTCCGASWDTQKNHFSKSADVLWQSNDGYIPICNSCRDAYYYKLVDLFNGNESKAIEYFCMQFGWVYDIEGLKAAKQISADRSRISHYGAKKNLGQVANIGKTYFDSMKYHYLQKPPQIIESPNDVNSVSDYKLTPKMIKFWGSGYDTSVYPTLQGYYDELLKLCESKPDVRKQKLMKNLCLLEYQMQVNIQAGKDIGTLSNSYKAMFEAAELKAEEADTSNDSFGKWIMEIEKYSPAEYYQDKKKYHDFFGIIEYIERFMYRPLRNLIFGNKEKEKEYWINDEDINKDGV